MSRLLISGCEAVATMDDAGTELVGGSILLEDGVIRWVGVGVPPAAALAGADVLDGRGCVAVPGLVNTHHHLYQTLTRARAQQHGLFGWLTELYPVWSGLGVRLHTHIAETSDEEAFCLTAIGLLMDRAPEWPYSLRARVREHRGARTQSWRGFACPPASRRSAAGHRPGRPAEGLSAPSTAGWDGAVSTPDRNPSALPRRLARAEARIHRARQEVPTE